MLKSLLSRPRKRGRHFVLQKMTWATVSCKSKLLQLDIDCLWYQKKIEQAFDQRKHGMKKHQTCLYEKRAFRIVCLESSLCLQLLDCCLQKALSDLLSPESTVCSVVSLEIAVCSVVPESTLHPCCSRKCCWFRFSRKYCWFRFSRKCCWFRFWISLLEVKF